MKKLLALVGVISLLASSVFAFHVKELVRPRKPLPEQTQKVNKPRRPMPDEKQLSRAIIQAAPLSWKAYLENLKLAAQNLTTYDFKSNVHPYLLEADSQSESDLNIYFSLKDYQAISGYFQTVYNKDPQQGTLQEYTEFYKGINNLSPREHYILPTIAIWQTGSVEAVLPFRHQQNPYWETPLLAAKAYDVMATIDPAAVKNEMQEYMRFSIGDLNEPTNRENVKKFFDTWRAQEDKNLPSVKDADVLEALALTE